MQKTSSILPHLRAGNFLEISIFVQEPLSSAPRLNNLLFAFPDFEMPPNISLDLPPNGNPPPPATNLATSLSEAFFLDHGRRPRC